MPFLLFLLLVPGATQALGPPVGGPALEEGELLDQVVAVVAPGGTRGRRSLITRSDLELEARVVLVSRGGVAAADRALPDDTLAAVLDWLIAEHLLLAEAEQLEVAAVEPAVLERELAAFRARFGEGAGYEDFLRRYEVAEADLARILRRRVVVDGYVSSRLRLAMSISDADVRRAFEARRESFGESSYDWVRPRLRAQLERERREALVAALAADLRGRAEVRVLVSPGGVRRPEPTDTPWYLPPAEGSAIPAGALD